MPTGTRLQMAAGVTASASFAPTDITGLVVWWDFSDATVLFQDTDRTSLVTADGDALKGVTDKSSAANHMTSFGTPVYKTNIKNGKSVVRVNNAETLKTINNTGISGDAAMTIVIVTTGPDFDGRALSAVGDSGGALSAMGIYRGVSANLYSIEFGGNNGYRPDTNAAKSAWDIIEARKSTGAINTTTTQRLNGTLSSGGTASTNTPNITDGLLAVASAFASSMLGDIGDVYLFNTAVSAGDLTSLRTYLSTKWDITVS